MTSDGVLNDVALLRLMQLVSPALPIGAYAYSQGLETAASRGWVHDETTARDWLMGVLTHGLTLVDLAVARRLYASWSALDESGVARWSSFLMACRETRELRAEDAHLGRSLARLLVTLNVTAAQPWVSATNNTWATSFMLAAAHYGVSLRAAMLGYAWAWAENQVAAAIKIVPLGQSAGQRVLSALLLTIPDCVDASLNVADDEIGLAAPGYALASMWHESEYTRLFQS